MHVLHSERYPDLIGLRGVVVAESKGCLFLANYCKAHKDSRRRQESGYKKKEMDAVGAEGGSGGKGNGGEVLRDKESAGIKKSMKVARVVKEDSVLAVVVTVSQSSRSMGMGMGKESEGSDSEVGRQRDGETPLQLLRRVCHSDITTFSPSSSCGDDQKKGPIIYLIHGEKCLPFCKGGIS